MSGYEQTGNTNQKQSCKTSKISKYWHYKIKYWILKIVVNYVEKFDVKIHKYLLDLCIYIIF